MLRLEAKAGQVAVLCNRFLLETALIQLSPNLSVTAAYSKYSKELVQRNRLTAKGQSIVGNITHARQELRGVKRKDVAQALGSLMETVCRDTGLVSGVQCP